jgi:serine/threonine-protein kinase HipA
MGRKRAHAPLNVLLNGRLVGVLRREATGAVDFRYEADWLAWESTFPISLSLPLREDRYIGTPVINVFDNLLPDSDPIRKRVAERVGAEGTDAHSLLTALGHARWVSGGCRGLRKTRGVSETSAARRRHYG